MTGTEARQGALEHEIGLDGVVHVRIHAGSVTIRGIDGTRARVIDAGGRDLADRFAIETGPNSLSIRPSAIHGELGIQLGGRRADHVEVEVPRGATVVAESVSGNLTASTLDGNQRYRTTSGELRLADVGGAVVAETVAGSLVIQRAGRLDLSARAVSGSVDVVDATLTRLALATTSGHIRLAAALDGSGPFAVRTVSGDARLAVGPAVRIEARTLTGRVRADRPQTVTRATGRPATVIAGDGPTLAFESVSGALQVLDVEEPPAPPEPPRAPAPPQAQLPPKASVGPHPAAGVEPAEDPRESERMAILRALERGEIDVAQATERLAAVDDGPPGLPNDATDDTRRRVPPGQPDDVSQFGGRT
jgi:hypothetical protein